MTIGTEYLKTAIHQFKGIKGTAEKAMEQIRDEELFWSSNEDSNSIAVIVKHMSGNMISRWTDFLTSDGEKSNRDRDSEFINDLQTRQHVMEAWEQGWHVFLTALEDLQEDDLLKIVTIRNEPHTVIKAIERQMSHYSYHVGQIVYIAKLVKTSEWNTLTIPLKK